VSSSAVVAVLALVVALSCAFVLRILWAERAVQDRPVGVSRARSATDSPDGKVTPEVVSSSAGPSGGPAASKPSGAPTQLVVHVVGQVAKPGLVRLAVGARVADAIEAAGGATRKGDVAVLNLARVVVDGEQILVPKPGEAGAGVAAPGASGAGATAPGAGAGGAGGLVNLNTADLTLLETLPGVGPVLAQRILDWRTEHGSFTSVEELGEVSGIGDKMLSQLRSKVTT
jgi:competence protein ComEA